MFWRVEGQTGLYVLFKTVCDSYDLLPADNYKLPPEAEGLEPAEEVKAPALSILKPDTALAAPPAATEDFLNNIGRTNTRRHIRQSPSVGSAVTTVLEADEEESDVTKKLHGLQIEDEEEEGPSEIPVIVESYEVEENREATAKEAEPQATEPSESKPPPQDDEGAASSTTSWDRMSSESVEEKPQEAPKTTEPVAEEAPPEEEEEEEKKNEEPVTEPVEPPADAETKDTEDAPEEKAEEKKPDEP